MCKTVGLLKISDNRVIDELIILIKHEVIPKIKGAAIDALALMEKADEKIEKCLAWAVRFEDDPIVRCSAAKTILNLNIFNNEQVVSIITSLYRLSEMIVQTHFISTLRF